MRFFLLHRGLPLLAILLLSSSVHAGGFGVVQDSDGYVNVRQSGSLKAEVTGRIGHGELVWVYGDAASDWLEVWHRKGHVETAGFVHGSRIKSLSGFEKLGDGKEASNRIVFQQGDLRVEIESEPVDPEQITVTKSPPHEGGGEWIFEIGGKPFYGTDGGQPRTKYRSIVFDDGSSRISLPHQATFDLYEPSLSNRWVKIYRDSASGSLYLTAYNSDGAGGYAVAFRIVGGKYAGRLVFSSF